MLDQEQTTQETNGTVKFFGIPCEGCTKRKELLQNALGSTDVVIYGVILICIAGILILKYYQVKAD